MGEIEDYIDAAYLAVLGRPADEEGKKNYVQLIKEGEIKKEVLESSLRSSDEYRERVGTVRDNKEIADFVKAKFVEVLKRMVDIGGLAHYTKEIVEGRIKKEELETILMESDEYKAKKPGKIVFCQGTYEERMEETRQCIERVQPGKYVDRAVIIVDETVTEESKEWLREHGCEVFTHPWEDSMVKMRNQYLAQLSHGDLVCVSDPDEVYGESLCRDLRKINAEVAEQGYGLMLLASHDVTIKLDGSVDLSISGFHKNLIYRYLPGVNYAGIGEVKSVHEVLNLPESTKVWTLPDEYYYEHFKSEEAVLERSFRNVYIAGGGNNAGTQNEHWQPLREIAKRLGMDTWPQVREYLRKGNIDKELLDWLISIKDLHGFDYENETQQCYKYYKAMHPKELESMHANPLPLIKDTSEEVMKFVEDTFLDVLHRHADTESKQMYTDHILANKIKREDFESILKESDEYKEKFGGRSDIFGDGIDWDKHVNEVLAGEGPISYQYHPLIDVLKKWKLKGRVLDCGCHIGKFVAAFRNAGYRYVGVDQSEYAIAEAKRRYPDVTFNVQFLWDMNFSKEFDIAFCHAVLQHNTLEEKKRIFPKIYDALKDKGLLLIVESTVEDQTDTQLTYDGWIVLTEEYGFKFVESWHKNEIGMDDMYLFRK